MNDLQKWTVSDPQNLWWSVGTPSWSHAQTKPVEKVSGQITPRHIMSLTNISHAILQVDSWPDSKQVLFATFFCVHLEMSINGLLFLSQSFPWYASLVVATSTTNKRVEL